MGSLIILGTKSRGRESKRGVIPGHFPAPCCALAADAGTTGPRFRAFFYSFEFLVFFSNYSDFLGVPDTDARAGELQQIKRNKESSTRN